jgi:hypothetical protein
MSSFLEFTVGPLQGGGAHKVRASGNGLVRGEVNTTSMKSQLLEGSIFNASTVFR